MRREASQLFQQELESFEPELKTIINEKLKQKLSEVLPKLQLKLIDDFRKLGSTKHPTQSGNVPDTIPAEHHDLGMGDKTSDMIDPLAFLESMDWGDFGDPNFDVGVVITQHQSEGSSEGSLAIQDLESTEGFPDMLPGKTKDSGYGSSSGMTEF